MKKIRWSPGFFPSLILPAVIAALPLPARAYSIQTRVTPANITTHSALFEIRSVASRAVPSANHGTKRIAYDIVITRKEAMDPVLFKRCRDGMLLRVTRNESEFTTEGVGRDNSVKKEVVGTDRIRFRFTATPAEVAHLSFQVAFPHYTKIGENKSMKCFSPI
ncbi:MAG: hypothetical protein V4671_08170 [Armatimonadota bacterium]